MHLGTRATADEMTGFDEVVVATGVTPRIPQIPGIDHPKVVTYTHPHSPLSTEQWMTEWGVGVLGESRGGLTAPRPTAAPR